MDVYISLKNHMLTKIILTLDTCYKTNFRYCGWTLLFTAGARAVELGGAQILDQFCKLQKRFESATVLFINENFAAR